MDPVSPQKVIDSQIGTHGNRNQNQVCQQLLTHSLSPLLLRPFSLNGRMEANTTCAPMPQSSVVKIDTLQVAPESTTGARMEEYQGVIVRGLAKLYQLLCSVLDLSPGEAANFSVRQIRSDASVFCSWGLPTTISRCFLPVLLHGSG